MKTATVREVQHHLNHVLRWIEEGEEVQITRRNHPVAKLISVQSIPSLSPAVDFHARAQRLWGEKNQTLSSLITDGREERI
jgi:prevent-host-death family protein